MSTTNMAVADDAKFDVCTYIGYVNMLKMFLFTFIYLFIF